MTTINIEPIRFLRDFFILTAIFACAQVSKGDVELFTERSAWEAAVAANSDLILEETFNGVPPQVLPSVGVAEVGQLTIQNFGTILPQINNGTNDRNIDSSNFFHVAFDNPEATARITLPVQVIAWGMDYNQLAQPVRVTFESVSAMQIGPENSSGFIGFVSNQEFDQIEFNGPAIDEFAAIVGMDNFVFAEKRDPIQIFHASGANAAAIEGTVDDFRDALGNLNANTPSNFAGGRRQINWDAAPDAVSAPNFFPGDFFNSDTSPRARGIEFSTPGSGFQLSATAASGVGTDFSNINPQYSQIFEPFSSERMFTPIGSVKTEVRFFDPADQETPAATNGFGIVFCDVDLVEPTFVIVYDIEDETLAFVLVEAFEPGGIVNESFSFFGITTDEPIIGRIEIFTGFDPLGEEENVNGGAIEVVVMDDIIYGEPVPVVKATAIAQGELIPEVLDTIGEVTNGDFTIAGNPNVGDGFDEDTFWAFDFNSSFDNLPNASVLTAELTLHLTPRREPGIATDVVRMEGLDDVVTPAIQGLSILPLGELVVVQIDLLEHYSSDEILQALVDGELGKIPMTYTDDAIVSFAQLDLSTVPGLLPGDVNQDGSVNLLDVDPMVELVTTGQFQPQADINRDGVVNLLDVGPFVELLSSGQGT